MISQGWSALSSGDSSKIYRVQSSTKDDEDYLVGDDDGSAEGSTLSYDVRNLEEGVEG